jgi:GTP cyclohydrolase I
MEAITPNAEDIIGALKTLIRAIGEDPDREGLIGTPDRIMRMWKEIFRGYDPKQKPKITTFANEEGMSDIVFDCGDYYSMCEHHILPFFGRYYFAYIPSPKGRILGISKVARVVGYCAARLQLQERLEQRGSRLRYRDERATSVQDNARSAERRQDVRSAFYGRLQLELRSTQGILQTHRPE